MAIINWTCHLAVISLVLLIPRATQAITYGNLLANNDVRFPTTECCVVPICNRPGECYQTQTCGYLCSSGKYPPVEHSNTPGYRMKYSYSRYECRFEDCKYYVFTCKHCPDPGATDFSIDVVREDCKECYYFG